MNFVLGLICGQLLILIVCSILALVYYSKTTEFKFYKKLEEREELERKLYYLKKIDETQSNINSLKCEILELEGFVFVDGVSCDDDLEENIK